MARALSRDTSLRSKRLPKYPPLPTDNLLNKFHSRLITSQVATDSAAINPRRNFSELTGRLPNDEEKNVITRLVTFAGL